MYGFDNFGIAAFNVFSLFTLDCWSIIMITIRNGDDKTYDGFFVITIIVGALFVLNLVTAVQYFFFERVISEQKAQLAK